VSPRSYFRAAVPEELFSNAELEQITSELNRGRSQSDIDTIFVRVLTAILKGHPKRADFLWKLGRSVGSLKDDVAEKLAYATAGNAHKYAYDVLNIGEAARALNVVFEVAQKLASAGGAQRVLTGATTRAADDTFARRLWEYTRDKDRNKVLTDFSNIDVGAIKTALIQHMRARYGSKTQLDQVSILQGDWWAFRIWGENSDEDREMAYSFWRQYVGQSRKRLAEAFNFAYPPNTTWDKDPTPILNSFFPVGEMGDLLKKLPVDDQLNESELKAVERFQHLLNGKWFDITKRDI